jgi:hypothetical protein
MERVMTRRLPVLGVLLVLCAWALVAQRDAVDAVEIGRHNTHLMPRGKEADGIVGDFVLRNNRVHALISGAQPLRRANMRTENMFVTQGCLYDLDLRGEDNDQITAFRPGNLGGEVSWVRVVPGVARGAAIEVVRTAEKGDGLFTRHEYRLEPDWQYILVESTYRNESQETKKIQPAAATRGFEDAVEWQVGAINVGDSVDPFDKRAYAWGAGPGSAPLDPEVELPPGQERRYQVVLAVADSPLAAYGVIAGLSETTGKVTGVALDSSGAPAIHARLITSIQNVELPHYPDSEGHFSFELPPGEYAFRLDDMGRDRLDRTVTVRAGSETRVDLEVSTASAVTGRIRDEAGDDSPAKVQFIGVQGTETPNFGTDYRAHGGDHQYQTHDGQFTQQVPPGQYLLRITRGPEHDLVERRISVGENETVQVEAALRRTVDTTGWVSTDFHSHTTVSGDNYCRIEDRLINLVAEHIEFAPTTEHNRIYDWAPYIDRMGLARHVRTIAGLELTGSGPHLNAFPLKADPHEQDGGAPVWDYDPRLNAIVLGSWDTPSLFPGGSRHDTYQNARVNAPSAPRRDRWVQINHPSVGQVFFDRERDGLVDGGYVGLEDLLDAAEVWSADILHAGPYIERTVGERTARVPNRTFGWLQMLNQGRHIWCVAVSDAHRVFNGAGGWRTYVPSSTDEPADIDPAEIIRNAKAGKMMITNGPFLEVVTGQGHPIGSTIVAEGGVELKIRVQAPDWIDVDRVQVMVSGRQPEELNFTRKDQPRMFKTGVVRFEETVRVTLQRDEHLIVVATGENSDLAKGFGRSRYGRMPPVAFTNPIYVDVDGDGFEANGDTLGHPLMTAPVTTAQPD